MKTTTNFYVETLVSVDDVIKELGLEWQTVTEVFSLASSSQLKNFLIGRLGFFKIDSIEVVKDHDHGVYFKVYAKNPNGTILSHAIHEVAMATIIEDRTQVDDEVKKENLHDLDKVDELLGELQDKHYSDIYDFIQTKLDSTYNDVSKEWVDEKEVDTPQAHEIVDKLIEKFDGDVEKVAEITKEVAEVLATMVKN